LENVVPRQAGQCPHSASSSFPHLSQDLIDVILDDDLSVIVDFVDFRFITKLETPNHNAA
jgi:hypothetical protein